VAFRDLVYDDAQGQGALKGVRLGSGSAATVVGRSVQQGAMQGTGRSLDIGISGPGYLQVKLPNGSTALTRDGNLAIDAKGRLMLHTGQVLQPQITIPTGTNPDTIAILSDGTVQVAKVKVGQIKLVDVPAPGALDGGPDNTFLVNKASGGVRAADKGTTILQGSLEGSEVDASTAMTDMIEAQRAFSMASKAIQTQDQILEIANQVKR
jgi:flagellar basal-body rod protein FlgG